MAVGTVTIDNAGDQSAKSTDWNGKSWVAAGQMPWGGDQDVATAVSCASYFCMAVGGSFSAGDDTTTAGAATWSAHAARAGWRATSPDLGSICGGGGPCGWASQLSCGSATNCMTVGRFGDLDWNGSSWNSDPAVPAGPGSRLSGLSCHASMCMAVGTQLVNGLHESLAEFFNGTSWSIVPTPDVT
jgi:hypothetical protein